MGILSFRRDRLLSGANHLVRRNAPARLGGSGTARVDPTGKQAFAVFNKKGALLQLLCPPAHFRVQNRLRLDLDPVATDEPRHHYQRVRRFDLPEHKPVGA